MALVEPSPEVTGSDKPRQHPLDWEHERDNGYDFAERAMALGLIVSSSQIVRETDNYAVTRHTEEEGPEGTILAHRRLHGTAYTDPRHGILDRRALTEDGQVIDEIDHLRGVGTDYYASWLKANPGEGIKSSKRVKSAGENGWRGLPTGDRMGDKIWPEFVDLLDGSEVVDEVGALGSAAGSTHLATVEMYAASVNEAHKRGSLWLQGIVPATLEKLEAEMGPKNIQIASEPVPVRHPLVRVPLTAAIIDPPNFVPNLLTYAEELERAGKMVEARMVTDNARRFAKNVLRLLDGSVVEQLGMQDALAEQEAA